MLNAAMTIRSLGLALAMLVLASCASTSSSDATGDVGTMAPAQRFPSAAPDPDPRVGLEAGVFDAETAIWNLRLVSTTPSPEPFAGITNSDLAFMGDYVIQGNYNGFQVWDVSDPTRPTLRKGYFCPASQSDVSVYGDLLFVSGEGLSGRLDCGGQGVEAPVSDVRLRGLRIFDISDLDNPVNVGNVQTCRGSHTHTVVEDPDDASHVYVYISGSARIRPPEELAGCAGGLPDENPNTALFRIEVIEVPIDRPEDARIVSSPRIFDDLAPAPEHGDAPADIAEQRAEVEAARGTGAFVAVVDGREEVLSNRVVSSMLEEIVEDRGGSGPPTAADSTTLRSSLQAFVDATFADDEPETGPTQCHDITVYPEIGLAGGACGGYGLLLDISDPANPRRMDAVADSNFSYWHSATFNNAGTKVLFTDEWGGGGGAKCRASDPPEWGANAIFTIDGGEMEFHTYYKLPAPQTPVENCVAHNGSLIPIPGRDVMVQGWYQGGISVFDWTDPDRPVEIAFFDRGPLNAERMRSAGSWSVYWYNGLLVNSEIARGLDVLQLTPSPYLTENEIEAARTVHLDHLNAQGQPRYVWPPSFALARAYLDQLERTNGLDADRIGEARDALAAAEGDSGEERAEALEELSEELSDAASGARDSEKVRTLAEAIAGLSEA